LSGGILELAATAREEGFDVEENLPLAPLTTLRVGGPAAIAATARSPAEVARLIRLAHDHGLPWTLIGGGSNLLVPDEGYPGLALLVRAERVEIHETEVEAEAGALLHRVVTAAAWAGLGDLTFAAGIPGTVGGAVVGNAGAWGRAVGECVATVRVVRRETLETVEIPAADLGFDYRRSRLQESGDAVLVVRFALEPADRKEMLRKIDEWQAKREARLPTEPCAGSFFRNLPPATPGGQREPVAKLLEAVGAKELHVGDAAVSPKHANVIVNLGHARARDVVELAAELERRVFERYGVRLVREVRTLR
jgi:UDP-N-acetylmuramate dehydrogenase